MIAQGPILLFDGVCNLCNGLVRFIIRRDKHAKIRFVQLQSTTGQELLQQLGLPSNDLDSAVYITGNIHYVKSSAVLHLLGDLDMGWKLFYGFIIIPKFIRDFFYNLIAGNRYRLFGKSKSCMIPAPEIEKRFIS